jgi:HEPN domain-containing protein
MSKQQHEQALLLVRKAEADLALLEEVRGSPRVSDEIIGFHYQQAAEKLLKAVLSEHGIDFPRTHNLRHLMDLLADHDQPVPAELADLDTLTPFCTLLRYDDLGPSVRLQRTVVAQLVASLYAWAKQHVP